MAGKRAVIGIDVGTGSARAAVFSLSGKRLGLATRDIRMWQPKTGFVQQSSEGIWKAVCAAVKSAMRASAVPPAAIAGIGFDATCSLVVLDRDGKPLSVSPDRDPEQNIIVWMDHRAEDQASRINKTGHRALRFVGGRISPEMQPPKLLWLKENMPATFRSAGRFFDLADWLTFRATGDETRSLCTTVCKWCYGGHLEAKGDTDSVGAWDNTFWETIGIPEFNREGHVRTGRRVRPMGEALDEGLTRVAARQLGLEEGTPVSVGIIDAHAGGLGLLGTGVRGRLTPAVLNRRLALIGGTSSCHMAVSREPRYIQGVWGPYRSAMIPGYWLTEGGQSAAGALIDHVIHSHGAREELQSESRRLKRSVYEALDGLVRGMAEQRGLDDFALLTRDRHVLPYHLGNRSPRADASLSGMATGLRLDSSLEDLALTYLATIQAIAYGTRHIIEAMNAKGYAISEIVACGGGTRSEIFLQSHADASRCRIRVPEEPEAVLLGAAMLGACAGGVVKSIGEGMVAMNSVRGTIAPARGKTAAFHESKYRVFHEHYRFLMRTRRMMSE